ncbi:MAG: HIT domain-containing protein [Anaerolineales bacterium]
MEPTCVFCRIVAGEESADVLYRGESLSAFRDDNPQAPTHILIVPNRHIESLREVEEEDRELLGRLLLRARRLAEEVGVAGAGYRLVLNVGAQAGQSVNHLHLHLLGGRSLRWPPG